MPRYLQYLNNSSVIGIIVRSCECVDSRLINHGFRVSNIAFKILKQLGGYNMKQMRDICLLSIFHDIGAYKTEEIDKMLEFETQKVGEHSLYGYLFIKFFSPLSKISKGVLYHHVPWEDIKDNDDIDYENKIISQVISISDRLDIYLQGGGTEGEYKEVFESLRGTKFAPQITDALLQIDFNELSRMDFMNDKEYQGLLNDLAFTEEEMRDYIQMIICTIDFRSVHTVPHTITTTGISNQIAKIIGLNGEETNKIICGAMLHDLGKIGIPMEILEFPGKLSPQAMDIMRTHVYITETILGDDIDEQVKRIAVRHHEKLDGSGYPHGLMGDEMTINEKIVAVADIISALVGTRSYKDAYDNEKVIRIISEMKDKGLLDPKVVDVAINNLDQILHETNLRCEPVINIYKNIHKEYENLKFHFA